MCFRRVCSLGLVVLFSQLQVVLGNDDNVSSTDKQKFGGKDDTILLVITSLFFAYCLSFLGFVYGYISYIDDKIMHRYIDEGELVQADIISTDLFRARTKKSGNVFFESNQKEFFAIVEYYRFPSEDFRVRVKKQVSVIESDLVDINHPELNAYDSRKAKDAQKETDPEIATKKKPHIIFNQDSFFQQFLVEDRKLQLMVLDGLPKSALPSGQIDRKLSFRYRLSSILFVLGSFMMTLLCYVMAIHTFLKGDDEVKRIGWTMLGVCTVLIILQLPCTHVALNSKIQEALEDEYFKLGEILPSGQEDSSISSHSDMFLVDQLHTQDSTLNSTLTCPESLKCQAFVH